MEEPIEKRVADADRERYARVLRTAYAEGRITEGELEERLQQVFSSRTETDLVPVVADLPSYSLADDPAEEGAARAVLPKGSRPAAAEILAWYFPALICTAIWLLTTPGDYFWPIWVFFGLSIPVGLRLIARLQGGSDDDGHSDRSGRAHRDQTS